MLNLTKTNTFLNKQDCKQVLVKVNYLSNVKITLILLIKK